MSRMRLLLLLRTCAALAIVAGHGEAAEPLQRLADVPLGGDTTRLDYASVDPERHLLFIAHLGDSAVIVFDTRAQRVVSRIGDLSKVHGVLAVPELGVVYATATGTNEVVAIDAAKLTIRARMPGGTYPDGMAYVPEQHKLYVSDEFGKTVTVVDVAKNERIATIELGGEVGNTQYDASSKRVFANVQTRKQLVEIDPATDQIVTRIDLPGAEENHGLLIDADPHRAYIACEGNDKLLVVDLDSKKVIAAFAVGGSPDVLAIDRGLHRLYVAGESGPASVFDVAPGAIAAKIADIDVGPNAHVVAVDPATHQVYFPLKNLGGRTMLRIMRP
jgi:YVTN family beta-propeller protein